MADSSLIAQFISLVGAENVLTTAADMESFLGDWRGRYRGLACCVVRPGNTSEVAAVVRLCSDLGVAIVPQGGNTSHCGASVPDASGESVLVSLSRLSRIRNVDVENGTMTVEAGCVLQTIQESARKHGRLFPLSLAAEGSCQIGGNLSTNAGGVQVLRYGNARELVLGLEVVLPSGEIWDGLRGLRKDNTGYDLKQLFIGAEGTLGIITAAVVKLFPLPSASLTAWLSIETPGHAVQLLGAFQARFAAALTGCELISDISLGMVIKHVRGAQAPLPPSPWYLLIELSGCGNEAALKADFEDFLSQMFETAQINDAVLAQSADQAERLWALRERISEAQKIEGFSIKHDISVPVSRIGEFIERADAALHAAYPGIRIVTFGHVGDGNLHYNQSKPEAGANADFMASQSDVNRIVHDIVHALGGSISAEHGIGQLKRIELQRYKSPVELEMMRVIKRAFDPKGVMNPGKVL